eukprot:1157022-Pyramimonas_sp.AAC.1
MQAAGRWLAVQPPPGGAGLTIPEHRGNRAFPVREVGRRRSWFHVYLDNWDQFTVGSATHLATEKGQASSEQLQVREAWRRHG